jgi:hypothetical protein
VRSVLVPAATARQSSQPHKPNCQTLPQGKNTHPLLLPSPVRLSRQNQNQSQSQTKPEPDQPTHWTGPCPAWSSAGPAWRLRSLPRSTPLELDGTEGIPGGGGQGEGEEQPAVEGNGCPRTWPTGGRQAGRRWASGGEMGQALRRLFDSFFSTREMRVMIPSCFLPLSLLLLRFLPSFDLVACPGRLFAQVGCSFWQLLGSCSSFSLGWKNGLGPPAPRVPRLVWKREERCFRPVLREEDSGVWVGVPYLLMRCSIIRGRASIRVLGFVLGSGMWAYDQGSTITVYLDSRAL